MKRTSLPWFILLATLDALAATRALADPNCSQYITEAKWGTEKVTSYFSGSYPSLQITLNRSGCIYSAADTDAMFEQIYAAHSQDTEWNSPKLSTEQMRNSVKLQLECQLSRSPVPNPITLEPRRETASLEAFKKASNCNAP